MKKEEISSTGSYPAIGPYSQAVKVDNFIFCSGCIPIDPKTNRLVDNDIQVQTRQAFENLRHILASAGASLDSIVKVTVYLKNFEDFTKMNETYATYFQKPYPSRSAIEASRLPKDARIEMECIAVIE